MKYSFKKDIRVSQHERKQILQNLASKLLLQKKEEIKT